MAILCERGESRLEDFNFIATARCLPLKALDGLLKIENGLVGTEKTSFEVGDILPRMSLCLLVLNDPPLERTDGLGRG